MNLRFEVKIRGDVVGRLVIIRYKKRILCLFVIDVVISKCILIDKSDCSYL